VPDHSGGFVLISSRDEKLGRKTMRPENVNGMLYPKDAVAGGTWISVDESGRVGCLLNGAFEKHTSQKNYTRSRGSLILEAFEYDNVEDFFKNVSLSGVEPFTLIFIENSLLWEFRWDAKVKFIQEFPVDHKKVWSSSTLYDSSAKAKRRSWFHSWRGAPLDFHFANHCSNPGIDLKMKLDSGVETVSITQVTSFHSKRIPGIDSPSSISMPPSMEYHNLVLGEKHISECLAVLQ
jgi:hypothetical protein